MIDTQLSKLVPVDYNGFRIYTEKIKTRFHKSGIYRVYIVHKDTKKIVHKTLADVNFGVYDNRGQHVITKEQVIIQAKKYINHNLSEYNPQKSNIKIGDLFYSSWGYDQTNYDYIIVTAISPSGKTVKARRTSHINKGHSGQSYKQQPINKPFGDTFQLKVEVNGGNVKLIGSYPYLYSGTGSKQRGYFSRVKKDSIYYETDTQFGH